MTAIREIKGKLTGSASQWISLELNRAAQNKLKYHSLLDDEREIPVWIDEVIRKAVHPNPYKRYQELSKFL